MPSDLIYIPADIINMPSDLIYMPTNLIYMPADLVYMPCPKIFKKRWEIMYIIVILMISEYALVRLESIAFGGILPTDVAPYTDPVHITIKDWSGDYVHSLVAVESKNPT